jgi:uncharacterized membrane protein YidH (DUF202 family)
MKKAFYLFLSACGIWLMLYQVVCLGAAIASIYATGDNVIEWYEYVISVLIMIVAVFTAIVSIKRFQHLRKHTSI